MEKKLKISGTLIILLSEGLILIQSTQVENFIADLATASFPNSALFFLRESAKFGELSGKGNCENFDQANVVMKHKIVSYYSMQLSSKSPSSFPFNTSFPVRIDGFNRRASVCKLVVVSIDYLQSHFLTRIKTLLAPVYHPFIRTDVDPWIWITSDPDNLKPFLLSRALPARTKYKLGISLTPMNTLVIKTVCLFCGDGGTPKLLDLSVKNPTEFDYFPDYVLNLNGKLLRLSAPAIDALIEIDNSKAIDAANNGKRGAFVSLFDEFLMIRLNFTYNIFISSGKDRDRGGGTGVELPDGSWIGVVGDVASGRAEIGLLATATPERLQQVSFTNSFFYTAGISFTTTQGSQLFSPGALLWTFDLLMWTCIGIATLTAFLVFNVLTMSMHWLDLDSTDAMTFSRRGIVSKHEWGIRHQILFTITAYLDQDSVLPRSTPLGCFVALWLFFTLIITTIYRTETVSLLAFPVLSRVPTTFEELVKSDYHVIFLKQGDAGYDYLNASKELTYIKLVKEMEIMTGVGTDCLLRVFGNSGGKKESCIAYDFSTTYIQTMNLSDADIRRLSISLDTTFNVVDGLVLESGSIYKESLDRWLRWTRPFHFDAIWLERDMNYNVRLAKLAWWKETSQTEKLKHFDGVENDNLTLKHISGAFYTLLVCLVISAVTFIYEIGYINGRKWLVNLSL